MTDHSLILKNIRKHIELDKKELEFFTSLLSGREVLKKEMILEEGKDCNYLHYVHSGAFRAYALDQNANERIVMFALNDWWVTDMHAFVNEKPSMLNIQAMEDSTILQLRKSDLEKLYKGVPKFERFFRVLMQNSYIREQMRVIQNLTIPAEERYINFIAKYPQVVQRAPLKQIASYLGVTPQFLSVIRARKRK